MSDLKPCINQATVMPHEMEEFLAAAANTGFKGVELRVPKIKEYMKKKELRHLVKQAKDYDIKIVSLNALEGFSLRSADEFLKVIKDAREMMELSSALECNLIVATPSLLKNREKYSSNAIIHETIKALKELVKLGEDLGVRVGFEFLGFSNSSIRTLDETLNILKAIDSDYVGVIVDSFHFYTGGSTYESLKELPIEKLYLVHVNDVKSGIPKERLRDEDRLLPGETGVIPLSKLLNIVEEKGYDGYVSVEIFNPVYWEMDLHKVIKLSMNSLNKFIKDK